MLYPPSDLHLDGQAVGPQPGEDAAVAEARRTGQARVRDVDGGAEILVPVSLGGSSALPPRRRSSASRCGHRGWSPTWCGWRVLSGLGIVLLAGALVLADRLGRSFVVPIRRLAGYAGRSAVRPGPSP